MERFSQREGFEEFWEQHKRNADEYAIEIIINVRVNDDQFANGRYDLREKKFAARLDPFTSYQVD